MQEQIILAPGASPTELLRSLARRGIGTFGLRVVSGVQLAQLALMRSGIVPDYVLMDEYDKLSFFSQFAPEEAGFDAPVKTIYDTLRSMRMLIEKDEEDTIRRQLPKGKFREKNLRLLALYEGFMAFCADPRGKSDVRDSIFVEGVDHARFKDDVAVMRLAIEKAEPLAAQIVTLREFPLSPLERRLAEVLCGGKPIERTLADLFGCQPAPAQAASVTAAYGSVNEVEDIIGRIYAERLPLDSCTVAAANEAECAQLFYEYAARYDIPVTFGCGVPIANSNAVRLLKLFYDWQIHGCSGVDALRNLIMSDSFDREKLMEIFRKDYPGFDSLQAVIELAGALKLGLEPEDDSTHILAETRRKLEFYRSTIAWPDTCDAERTQQAVIGCAGLLARFLADSPTAFVRRFARIRHGLPGRVDRAAAEAIGRLMAMSTAGGRPMDEAALSTVMNSRVCREASCEGHLHITGITGALSTMRDHLFVAGMSAAHFPGSPVENYLLLDCDYCLFGSEADPSLPTSGNRVRRTRQSFFDLTGLAGALGIPVHISYSDADLAALKDSNPSSVLYELLDTDDIGGIARKAGFFGRTLSSGSAVGARYLGGEVLPTPEKPRHTPLGYPDTGRIFSPTTVESYFTCPLRFYLCAILGLKEPETDDPTQVISATQLGTLVHGLMEKHSGGLPDYDAFMADADLMFDGHLDAHCPFNQADVPVARSEFLDIAAKAYAGDPGGKAFAAELETEAVLAGGLRLRGRVDRVEMAADGSLIIVDYKTSHRVSHIDNDVDSCMQALLYAAMLEQNGIKVSRCEYRYLRLEKTVTCEYNDSVREQLNERLAQLCAALASGDFPCAANKPGQDKICEYCPAKRLCERGVR